MPRVVIIKVTDEVIRKLIVPNVEFIKQYFPADIAERLINDLKNISDDIYDILQTYIQDAVNSTRKRSLWEPEIKYEVVFE